MKTVEITYRYQSTGVRSERPADAKAALSRLDQGSRAFAMLLDDLQEGTGTARRTVEVDPRDLGFGGEPEAPEQRPFAAVLGCSDARVPVELIFNEGPNDLFVVRVAAGDRA
jgi:carbonic anhydrase